MAGWCSIASASRTVRTAAGPLVSACAASRTGLCMRSQQHRSSSSVVMLASTITVSNVVAIGTPVLRACSASVGLVSNVMHCLTMHHIGSWIFAVP